ncbi:MAG: DUF6089 family protein [Cytophagales bacterium]
MNILRKLLFFFIILIPKITYAQFSELGGGVGASNVRSDVGVVSAANTRFGANLFYRMNFSHIWVGRAELKYVNIASDDKNYPDLISKQRNYSFYNNAIEVSLGMEFNFLNFRYPKNEHRWCPFLTASLANFSTFSNSFGSSAPFNLAIPFGFGIKYKLSDHWNLGFVYTATKTFSDKIDNISSSNAINISQKIKGNDESANDWYHYAGFTISYTIYKLKCPKHLEDETTPEYWQRQFR